MDLLRLPGADAVLARHAEALPQPDQLCGPWSAHVALHAMTTSPPAVVDLAIASGTRIFPSDVAEWRPPGAPLLTSGWSALPRAESPRDSGTDAAGLAHGIELLTGVAVVPVRRVSASGLARLLSGLLDGPAVGVVANVDNAALDPHSPLPVGHFVALWGCSADGAEVGIADTYAQLGTPDQPPGCRVVGAESLHAGLTADPGRGLLLLTAPRDVSVVRDQVGEAGGVEGLWAT